MKGGGGGRRREGGRMGKGEGSLRFAGKTHSLASFKEYC